MTRLLANLLLGACLLVVGVAALGVAPPSRAAGPQLAQERSVAGVEDLWNEYPLEEDRADPQSPAPSAGERSNDEAQPARDPAPDVSDERDPTVRTFIALGIVAILAVVLARAVGSSWSAPAPPEPAAAGSSGTETHRNVYVEGSTERDSIGDFRGFVHDTTAGDEPSADSLYISDPARAGLLWIRRSEVTTIRVPDADGVEGEGEGVPAGRFTRSPASRPPSAPA